MNCFFCKRVPCACSTDFKNILKDLQYYEDVALKNNNDWCQLAFPPFILRRWVFAALGGHRNFKIAYIFSHSIAHIATVRLLFVFPTFLVDNNFNKLIDRALSPELITFDIICTLGFAWIARKSDNKMKWSAISNYNIQRKIALFNLEKILDNKEQTIYRKNATAHLQAGLCVSPGLEEKSVKKMVEYENLSLIERLARLRPSIYYSLFSKAAMFAIAPIQKYINHKEVKESPRKSACICIIS